MAAPGLQPSRHDGTGEADASRLHADPAIRHAADARRAHPRPRRHGAAAYAPPGIAGRLAPMLLAAPVAAALGAAPAGAERRRVARLALPATVAAALAIGAARLMAPIERTDGAAAPISALIAVPPELRRKPVLNDYAFGGYLNFAHVRPFIDARVELYGDAMLIRYDRLQRGDRDAVE